MPDPAPPPVARLIRRLVADARAAEEPDHALVARFVESGDESDFAGLLRRHGGLVLSVCRSVLGNDADAEDAFQATFLILARKAGSIRERTSVASWLHGVARRTALKARARSAARRKREALAPERDPARADDLTWREMQEVLHEELAALPERYRGPLVACYLEGQTQDRAAARLGVGKTTLKERLERGRELLRARLDRRGLGPVAVLAAAVCPVAAPAAVPANLVAETLAVARIAGAVPTPAVLALTQEVLKSMTLAKFKFAALLVGSALLAGGAGVAGFADPAEGQTPAKNTVATGDGPETPKPPTARTWALPEKPFRYADLDLPEHFKTPHARRFDNTPADNPVSDGGATLGRVLFYDTRLSANGAVSCGSCHAQKNAFADPNRSSVGLHGERTDRHAMSIVNLRYVRQARFFWDERAGNLESMVLLPIQSKLEMGQDVAKLVETLGKDGRYAPLFRAAFGDEKVTAERVGKALAQFVRSMVSCQSKFDEGVAKAKSVRDDFPNFTAEENRGKALFVRNCAICHMPEGQSAHFAMVAAANNGLDADAKSGDGGVGDITLNPRQLGRFKPPSLRNVEVTAPYMHDGRFDTLEKVIDHYSDGLQAHPNLDPRLEKQHYTAAQKADLLVFLKTLTDRSFLTDPKFADPFK